MTPSEKANFRFGLMCAIGAQVLWGCFPLYIYVVKSVDSVDFVAHRAIWSFALLASLVVLSRWIEHPSLPKVKEVRTNLRNRNSLLMSALAAILIATNWLAFVWAVTNDHALDASLGYYICPQVVVLLGVIFLGERLSALKWIAVAFAVCGVGYMMATAGLEPVANPDGLPEDKGKPWVAIIIAISFGFYGLVKKRTQSTALGGLTFETGFLLVPALAYLIWRLFTAETSPFDIPWFVILMLLGSGLATIAPLALYATAVKHVPLSTVGFLQYIGPTLQFIIGIFVFSESLDYSRLTGFAIVWVGVGLFLFSIRRGK